jgi:hypothetical protein
MLYVCKRASAQTRGIEPSNLKMPALIHSCSLALLHAWLVKVKSPVVVDKPKLVIIT